MLAISLGIFSLILYVSTFLVSTSTSNVGIDSAFRAVETIREAADFIYIHGHPSRIEREVAIPKAVEELEISGHVVRMRVISYPSYTDVYEITKGNMTSDLRLVCPNKICKGDTYLFVFKSLPPIPKSYDVNVTCVKG